MQDDKVNYNERVYFAPNDKNFESVQLKSEVWRYFKRNTNNQCRCNLCGAVYQQMGQGTTNMFKHLNTTHGEEVFGFFRIKKAEEGVLTDFLEDIIADGFPAEYILQALIKLFTSYRNQFNQLTREIGDKMTKARLSVKDFFDTLDLFTDKKQASQLMKIHYPELSEGSRKILLQQNFWMLRQDHEIIEHFANHGYKIHTHCQMHNLYSSMVIVTDTMRNAYLNYGDNVSIAHIDRVFKKRSPRGFDQFSCWYITGFNEELQVVLFGFALMSQATIQHYNFVFQTFFNQMGNIYPLSICTPPLPKLQATLQSFSPEMSIITNWYHKLKYLKQLLEDETECKNILRNMCELMQTCSQEQYYDIMGRFKCKLADQQILKYRIKFENYRHCIITIQRKFMGFSIQAQGYLQVERLIRKNFIYQQNLARLFIFVLQLDRKLNSCISNASKVTSQASKQGNDQIPFSYLHHQLKKRWKKSLDQQGQLILKKDDKDISRVIVYEKDPKMNKARIYTVKFLIEHDHWACNCKYLQQTGLICKHLNLVIKQFEGSLEYYLNPRWKKKIENRQQDDSSKIPPLQTPSSGQIQH